MRARLVSLVALGASLLATGACGEDSPGPVRPCCDAGQPAVRVVNAFTKPIDVLVGNTVVLRALAAGAIDTVAAASGTANLGFREAGTGGSGTTVIVLGTGATPLLSTYAVVRERDGTLGAEFLDDTNSVVPAGATKVRVLHLAPNAGTLQVFRTQPDFAQPVSWQFPFDYQPDPTSLSAPFYQSTPGTWEIRVWKAPADASGWASAPTRVLVPLAGGEKRTVVILDAPGGGVRVETF